MNFRTVKRFALIASIGFVTVAVVAAALDEHSVLVAGEAPATSQAESRPGSGTEFSPFVDRNGNISLPRNYRREWAHLGSWAVATKPGEAVHELHDVYTQLETVASFNESGEFPDGAVLVKEVRATQANRLTTGHAAWSTEMKVWFVMVKDREGRFEDNPHWGDGWGWALFEAKDPTKNVSVGYDTSCLSCHAPAEASDWVYTYAYPDLKQPAK